MASDDIVWIASHIIRSPRVRDVTTYQAGKRPNRPVISLVTDKDNDVFPCPPKESVEYVIAAVRVEVVLIRGQKKWIRWRGGAGDTSVKF